MNQQIKKMWIDGLRSGAYNETGCRDETCFLKFKDIFSHEGALCDLLKGYYGHWTEQSNENEYGVFVQPSVYCFWNECSATMIPGNLSNMLGLTSKELICINEMRQSGLVFADISDWIEEFL